MSFYFTADTHFNHARTLELSKRPFKDVDEMNTVLISNWNGVVGNDDIVIHLGDFGDPGYAKWLHGKIILVPGNYERDALKESPNYYDELKACGNIIITKTSQELIPSIILHDPDIIKAVDNGIVCTHEPIINSDPISVSHMCNLFGHIHKLQMVKPYGLNVGTDAHNFTPIGIDTIEFYINAIIKYYDKCVFE